MIPLADQFMSNALDALRIPHDAAWIAIVRESNLLFVTWPIDPDQLRGRLPKPLELDLFDGAAWLTLETLEVGTAKLRGLPAGRHPIQGVQVNVRTYVRCGNEQGIHMLSLDCPGALGNPLRRALFRMPFFTATSRVTVHGDNYHVESMRTAIRAPRAQFAASGRIAGPPARPKPGSLDAFLLTRSIVFPVTSRGRVYRGEVAHRPRTFQPIDAVIEANTMISALGLEVRDTPALLHYSQGDDAVAWPFTRVRLAGQSRAAPIGGLTRPLRPREDL